MSIGKRISPVLIEIEMALWEYEAHVSERPGFTDDGFRSALKIFMSALLDKMWSLQKNEAIPMDVRCDMAQKAGEQMRQLVKTYTDIDPHTLYP